MKTFTLTLALLLLASCGSSTSLGGSEAGNPLTATVTGDVSETTASLGIFRQAYAMNCLADRVIAATSVEDVLDEEVDENCEFTLELTTGKTYTIHFRLQGILVGALTMTPSATQSDTTTFFLSDTLDILDLGRISFDEDDIARPANNPYELLDRDDDGEFDFDDEDDDGDGIFDDEELDCDDDDFFDDDDEDDAECDIDEEDGDDEEEEEDDEEEEL